ncbi:MAG: hypothetical protein ACR2KF_02035 [Nitrososphaeraceae archaeon]
MLNQSSISKKTSKMFYWWYCCVRILVFLPGNLTLIGSSAGVVAVGISAKYGFRLTFNQWFKIGLPFTVMTVIIGMASLYLYSFFGIDHSQQ